ncbi:MAG: branched-chain amino acid ABC transporter permease [Chloroflexi bacterium]|nr:branched-chain amino acid ABC transporter permease [Chloroflexota bacterium]
MPQFALPDYVQFLVSGLSTGSIYVLIALGLITIYSVTGVVNLAQGEFVMLGAFLAVALGAAGLPLALAAPLAVLAVMAVGAAVYHLTIRPAHAAPDAAKIIITIGTAITLRGLALLAWGTTPRALGEFSPGAPLHVLGAVLSRQRLWIMGAAAVALVLLYLFLDHTLLGKAVRACAVHREAALIVGIDAARMGLLAYALSAGLGALAGIVIAPLTLVSYDMGLSLGLKGFVVAIMGGLVNAPAAVAGGLLLGVVESFASGLLSAGVKNALAYLVLFAVLVARTVPLAALATRLLPAWLLPARLRPGPAEGRGA